MPLVADDRIIRTGVVGVVAAIALSFLLATLGEPAATAVAGVVAVVLIALGSPHGALDHLVLARSRRGPAPSGRRSALAALQGLSPRFVTGYVALAAASLAGYLLAPRLGFALFLVLSVAHFAAGEAGVAVERGLARGWRDPLAWAASLGGVVVVVVPLAGSGAGSALAAVDPRLAPVLTPLPALAALTVVAVAATLLGCLVAALRGDERARTVALELAALSALAVLAHPLIAFAAFFACWHSLRHQARLAQELRPEPDRAPADLVGRPHAEVLPLRRGGRTRHGGRAGSRGRPDPDRGQRAGEPAGRHLGADRAPQRGRRRARGPPARNPDRRHDVQPSCCSARHRPGRGPPRGLR